MALNECIEALKSTDGFPENWINQFSFGTDTEQKASIPAIYSRTNLISNLLYDKLNYSILSGEYLDSDTTDKALDEVLKYIENIPPSIELPEALSFLQNQLSSALLFNFVNPFKTSIRDYKSFIHKLNRTLKFNEHALLFDAVSLNQTFSLNFSNDFLDAAKLSRVFVYNIRLATIDHNLSVKKEILNELILIKNELEKTLSNSQNIFDKVLIDKCNYLIKKILYRFKEDSKNYLYAFDFVDKELNPYEIEITFYKEFDEITEGHYEINHNHSNQRKKWIEDVYVKKENKNILNFKDYHVAIKEYKDGTKNLAQVENLNSTFKQLYSNEIDKSTNNQFDKRALHTTCNYMANNEFSFLIGQNETLFSVVVDKYKEIKNLQVETRIKNYFPCVKYTYYLSNKIDTYFKSPGVTSDEVKPFINKFESAIKDCYENYEWCKDKNFLAFQLPSEECKIKYKNNETEYSFFLSSSFVLPLNYEKILGELKEFSRKLEKYKTLFEVHENLKAEKSSIKELRENIEKSDRRSIEILGIFAAVVLFTSSSVQIFSIKDIHFKDALKFMLCFSYSLTLFISLIWLITRENIKSVTTIHKIFFLSLAFVALISLLFTLGWFPFN